MECDRKPMRVQNLCNACYLKHYFARHPDRHYTQSVSYRRSDLWTDLAALTNLKHKEAEAIVAVVLKVMADAIKRGEEISIPGFGLFGIRSKIVFGTRRKWCYFLPAKELRDMVRKGI